ncbi:MAG TPA: polyprenol monophosphomannose synthase [Thermoleophilaceae bacterium]|nr:polyprenol monophosphomannose synthase [Thermoleophilaceae bacterium]
MPGAWLILPTYNEAENVDAIVRAALAELATTGRDHTILVVDDGSPDGTGEIADRLAEEHDAVRVLHRAHKQGLGRAYLAGFDVALADGAELVLEMDADFSHDPADLPRLIAAADDADVVLGSRYVEGGGVENWGALRRLVSRGGSWYARMLLRVPVRDLTGGYKCFRGHVLRTIDLNGVHANGYGFQIELTYRAIQAGFTVEEIPIRFRERREGHSKMTPRIALEAVWKVPAMRFRGR